MISAKLDKNGTTPGYLENAEGQEEKLDQSVILNVIGDRIEDLIRDNQCMADTLQNAHIDARDPSPDDVRLIYSTLLECMGTQRAILYLFYMALQNGKAGDWGPLVGGNSGQLRSHS